MSDQDIAIMAGAVFTTAKVESRTVAVFWGSGQDYYVSDGAGSPLHCESRSDAVRHLMRVAMTGQGAATVRHVDEAIAQLIPAEPTPEILHAVEKALDEAAGTGTGEARAAARAVLTIVRRQISPVVAR